VIVLDDGVLVFDAAPSELACVSAGKLRKWGLSAAVSPRPAAQPDSSAPDFLSLSAAPYAFECHDLSFGPVRDFSLAAHTGSVIAITGESGSGKTLLLELIAGLRAPEGGSVEFRAGHRGRARGTGKRVEPFSEFVADDVAFGPRNSGLSGKDLVACVSSAMDLVGLPFSEFADRQTFSSRAGNDARPRSPESSRCVPASFCSTSRHRPSIRQAAPSFCALIVELGRSGRTVVFTTNREEECSVADVTIRLPDPPGADSLAHDTAPARPPNVPRAGKPTKDQQNLERLRRGASRDIKPDSPLHRISPLSKYLLTFTLVAAALSVRTWFFLAILCAFECVPVAVSRYGFKRLAIGILKILPWLLFWALSSIS
jgi:energy-coupling factor transport system ATP-binding protein